MRQTALLSGSQGLFFMEGWLFKSLKLKLYMVMVYKISLLKIDCYCAHSQITNKSAKKSC